MDYILMQLDNSPESLTALKHLIEIRECRFELSLDRPWIRPILFGSRSNLSFEEYYYFVVSKITSDRRSIIHNHCYLWRKTFYWICDCNSIKEILEYTGSIHQLRHWPQDFLAMILASFVVLSLWWKILMSSLVTLTPSFINISLLLPSYDVMILNHALLGTTTICSIAVPTHIM